MFLATDAADWLASLFEHHTRCMLEPPSSSQHSAWINSAAVLRSALTTLLRLRPETAHWTLIFEYELPRERGRRPDVVLLAGGSILVLEFKDFATPLQAHLDQVAAYARDLRHYHAGSHNRLVLPVLVPTLSEATSSERDGVRIMPPVALAGALAVTVDATDDIVLDLQSWLYADYAPLPSLVAAARTIFQHEPLPQIRRAQSAGIAETVAQLVQIVSHAEARSERHLALVTGVPGAGKTLVGLQFVYHTHFEQGSGRRAAVFLSGNRPLVQVLQYALGSKAFVQDVHGFLRQYGVTQDRRPAEHIWVYDEAQRAFDAAQAGEKRAHHVSEPEDFLHLGQGMPGWAAVVGLIGEGQEIHVGEEEGLQLWNDAIAATGGAWTVHCPTKLESFFTHAAQVRSSDDLDLTTSLRSHLAEDVQHWVAQLLRGELPAAAATAAQIRDQGFHLYVTQDLRRAAKYVHLRYRGQQEKRYGLLASSKARNLARYGVNNDYEVTKNLPAGPWYHDPPASPRSCCQLRSVATEFAAQGLELDFPLISWGDDLRWVSGKWVSPQPFQTKARDPHQLRLNSYRVLLSRGRDGLLVFVPPTAPMETTFGALTSAGLTVLR